MTEEQIAINRLVCGNTAHSCKADYIKTAIKALEEIQQYRAIGTVDECAEMQVQYNYLSTKIKKYEAIGTVDEFKALKEKSVAKKPIDKIMYLECPTCGDVGILDCGYCSACGQKLDWGRKE